MSIHVISSHLMMSPFQSCREDSKRIQRGFREDSERVQRGFREDSERIQRGFREDSERIQRGFRANRATNTIQCPVEVEIEPRPGSGCLFGGPVGCGPLIDRSR